MKPGVVVYIWNPSALKLEAGESGQPWVCSEFKVIPSLKNKQKLKKKKEKVYLFLCQTLGSALYLSVFDFKVSERAHRQKHTAVCYMSDSDM